MKTSAVTAMIFGFWMTGCDGSSNQKNRCTENCGQWPAYNADHLQQVLNQKICLNCELSGANFNGLDLRGVVFTGSNLSRADFRNANLQGADLSKTNLQTIPPHGYTNFSGADLTDAIFKDAKTDEQIRFEGVIYCRTTMNSGSINSSSCSGSLFF